MSMYLNYGALTLLGIMLLIIYLVRKFEKKRGGNGYYITLWIMVIGIFLDAYYSNYRANKNIDNFLNKEQTLKCVSGRGLYNPGSTYKVAHKDGWRVSKHFFTKNSFSINASKCEAW